MGVWWAEGGGLVQRGSARATTHGAYCAERAPDSHSEQVVCAYEGAGRQLRRRGRLELLQRRLGEGYDAHVAAADGGQHWMKFG